VKRTIINFFDRRSKKRDRLFEKDPIYGYEQRMRQEILLELLRIKGGELVLDAGCGNARDILRVAAEGAECIGVDISGGMIQEGYKKIKRKGFSERVSLIVGDVTNAPFKNSVFDKIICSEVLEHIPHWKVAIGELSRVLKDEGTIVVTTPNNISMYGLQRKFVDVFLRWWRPGHPYDNWKNFFILRKAHASQGLNISEVRGACYLPGMVSYIYPWKAFLSSILSTLKDMEEHFLSKNKLTKYLGYVIGLRLVKRRR